LWGFSGAYISDWGAVSDVVMSFKNGLNVEMPGLCDGTKRRLVEALQNGALNKSELDEAVQKIIELGLKSDDAKTHPYHFDLKEALALAERAAAESAVLLKNDDGLLPLTPQARIALIGAFAKQPRYQGTGSSRVTPVSLDNAFDAFLAAGFSFSYAPGYDPETGAATEQLLTEAETAARDKDAVILFAGLPEGADAEGRDRTGLDLPAGQVELIQRVAAVNPRVAVVLQCGGAVTMPWIGQVQAALLTYLSGCRGGSACVSLLTGRQNPCGKLAETFPLRLEDTPCYDFYHQDPYNALYAESIFTGYRYYDTARQEMLFPFGHGLSYTEFNYSDLKLDKREFVPGDTITVSLTVTNAGLHDGKEIVQLYVSHKNPPVFKAQKELKGFKKVFIKAGETARLDLELEDFAFRFYNTAIGGWDILSGNYEITVGPDSRGTGKNTLSAALCVKNPVTHPLPDKNLTPSYDNIQDNHFNAADFLALRRASGPADAPPPLKMAFKKPFTFNTPVSLIKTSFWGRLLYQFILYQGKAVRGTITKQDLKDLEDLPLRLLPMAAKSITKDVVDAAVDLSNGKVFKALKTLRAVYKK
jgi:beta-glucosidase